MFRACQGTRCSFESLIAAVTLKNKLRPRRPNCHRLVSRVYYRQSTKDLKGAFEAAEESTSLTHRLGSPGHEPRGVRV